MEFLQTTISQYMQSAGDFTDCTTEDTVGAVVDKIQSSHDALLVYHPDSNGRLAGLLVSQTPTGKTAHPHNAKVGNFMVVPPRLSTESSVMDVLHAMLSLRLNILPLRDVSDEVLGVVTVGSILEELLQDNDAMRDLAAMISPNKPITAPMSSTVGEVARLMDERAISRVVLTSDSGAVAGIVSRRDLLDAYIDPSDRQRFSTRDGSPKSYAYDAEAKTRDDDPVAKYARTKVETALDSSPAVQPLRTIVGQEHSSVVLVNEANQPTGFISRRDVLEALAGLKADQELPIIFKHTDMDVSEADQQQLDKVAQVWAAKVAQRMPFSQIVVSYEVAKTGEGRVREIETTVIVDPASGPSSDSLIAKSKSRSWIEGLRQAIDNINTQLRRKDRY